PDVDEPDVDEPDVEEPDSSVPDVGIPDGQSCDAHEQCTSGYCNDESTCAPDPCTNNLLDPGETDIDCGGICANQCAGYQQVAAGSIHTCAIRADTRVICWGGNSAAQLPPALEDVEFSSVSAG